MTEAKRIMTMDDFEHRLLVGCINKARTEYMEEGKPTEDIDDLLIKAIDAPIVVYYDYERIWAIFQNLYVFGNSPCSAFDFCGTADRKCG